MNAFNRKLVKGLTLFLVLVHCSVGQSTLSDQEKLENEQFQNEIIKNSNPDVAAMVIAKLNDSAALAAAIGKEPKFFDDFECKYVKLYNSIFGQTFFFHSLPLIIR